MCSDDPTSRRTVAEVCIEELAALACAVLSQVGASPQLEVGRAMCRMIGPSRMTPEAEVRINQSLERLLQLGTVVEREGVVMLARR